MSLQAASLRRSLTFLSRLLLSLTALLGVTSAADVTQEIDQKYSAEIKNYTTDPKFSTDLVNYLPMSRTVPTPEKVLGYAIGTPGHLTYTKDIYRYYQALSAAPPRVKMWTVGKSEEGRDFVLVAVSDEANMRQIETLRTSQPSWRIPDTSMVPKRRS